MKKQYYIFYVEVLSGAHSQNEAGEVPVIPKVANEEGSPETNVVNAPQAGVIPQAAKEEAVIQVFIWLSQ